MASRYEHGGLLAALLAGAALVAPVAQADTLTDTLIKAYQFSPVLETARAQLRTTDEGVAAARAGLRPRLNATASSTTGVSSQTDFDDATTDVSVALNLSQRLYDSGATRAAIEEARALVASGRFDLKSVEQDVLLNAVTIFVTVRRDMEFVDLARSNVRVLEQQVQAARDRFDVGEVTRTDVSLARARLAEAQANLSLRLGQLEVSRAQFRQVVGVPPRDLAPPPPLPDLPRSSAIAQDLALKMHPDVRAARFNEIAASFDLKQQRAGLGPTVDATADVTYRNNEARSSAFARETDVRNDNSSASLGIRGTLPIYSGGALSSAVRRAQATVSLRKAQLQNTARSIRQEAAAAYADLEVARAQIQANIRQVEAARIAFEGVREEAQLGARTTLDELDREQELRDAQTQLASARRDEYVSAYSLLAATGLLSVEHLGLGVESYDPAENFNRVQRGPYSAKKGSILDKIRDRYSR